MYMALISVITHLRIAHQHSKKDFPLSEIKVTQTKSTKTSWELSTQTKDPAI